MGNNYSPLEKRVREIDSEVNTLLEDSVKQVQPLSGGKYQIYLGYNSELNCLQAEIKEVI